MSEVVLITGAGGGIGRALAAAWRARGARLVLLDLKPPVDLAGDDTLVLPCDVTDPHACEAALARAVERFGGIDVLVNNAGITHRSLFVDTEPEVLRKVIEVNFFGSVHVTRAALPSLVARKGHIVVLSSVAGFAPLLGRTGYSASKHALHGFFESLREEVRHLEVGVSMICPSYVDTPLRDTALNGRGGTVDGKGKVAGRMLAPADVAAAVLDAVDHRRRTAVVSRVAQLSWVLSRVAPRAYAALMRRNQRSEFGL